MVNRIRGRMGGATARGSTLRPSSAAVAYRRPSLGMPCRPRRPAALRPTGPPRHPLRSRRRQAPSAREVHTRSRLRWIWVGNGLGDHIALAPTNDGGEEPGVRGGGRPVARARAQRLAWRPWVRNRAARHGRHGIPQRLPASAGGRPQGAAVRAEDRITPPHVVSPQATICDGSVLPERPSATARRSRGDHLRRVSDLPAGRDGRWPGRFPEPRTGSPSHYIGAHAGSPRFRSRRPRAQGAHARLAT